MILGLDAIGPDPGSARHYCRFGPFENYDLTSIGFYGCLPEYPTCMFTTMEFALSFPSGDSNSRLIVTWYGVPSEPTCWLSCILPSTAFSIDCGLLVRVLVHGTHSLGCEMIQLVYSHLLGNPVLRAVCSIVKFAVKIKLWLPQFAFAGWAACLNLKGYVTHQCIGSFVNASFVLSIRTLCADAFCACRGLRDYLAPCQLPMVRRNLVDPASSHMLVSKIKPCMSQYKLLYGETANGSLKQL